MAHGSADASATARYARWTTGEPPGPRVHHQVIGQDGESAASPQSIAKCDSPVVNRGGTALPSHFVLSQP